MIKVEIDGIEFLVKSGISILEACEFVGIDVPRFCFHQTLSIAGNCRMCLIEIVNSPKPVASCALTVSNNMKILTDTPLVKKARENVLEILLVNHPLDCPICDQGGECDLQDQSNIFGIETSRYFFEKRVVDDKNCGPLIKTIMTRCIHCTRCVRFNSEISGQDFFGTLNRGSYMQIGPYVESSYKSNISGNVIDLCPVGALTSKDYAFIARPWELRTNETIDFTDGLGSNIYISSKESDIVRIFPKSNNQINERFISDKARFYFDSNKINRVRDFFSKNFNSNQIDLIKSFLSLKTNKSLFLLNNLLDLDSAYYTKALENINIVEQRPFVSVKNISNINKRSNFFISWTNASLQDFNSSNKFCFIVSSNLEVENVILNIKIRLKKNNSNLSCFGFLTNLSEDCGIKVFNLNIFNFINIFESKSLYLSKLFINSKNPVFIVGESVFRFGVNFDFFYFFVKKIAPTSIIVKIQNTSNAEGIASFNIGNITRRSLNNTKVLFCLDIEDSFFFKKYLSKESVLVFFSTHISELVNNSKNALLLFPWPTCFEKNKVFLNLEQRFQKTAQITYTVFNKNLWPYKKLINFFFDINQSQSDYTAHLSFIKELIINLNFYLKIKLSCISHDSLHPKVFNLNKKNFAFSISTYPSKNLIEDFYLSSKMLKNSKIMQKFSQFYRKHKTFMT